MIILMITLSKQSQHSEYLFFDIILLIISQNLKYNIIKFDKYQFFEF